MRDLWAVPAQGPPEGHKDKPKCIRSQGQELMHLERKDMEMAGVGFRQQGVKLHHSVELIWPDMERELLGELCSALPL